MRNRTLLLFAILAILFFIAVKVLANVKAEKIKIKISETCVEKVEEAAATVEGVIETNWNEETGELGIIFKQDETNLNEIEKAISEAGFDTPNFKAPEQAAARISKECREKKSIGF